MDTLPLEALLKVLSYLDVRTLKSFRVTSRENLFRSSAREAWKPHASDEVGFCQRCQKYSFCDSCIRHIYRVSTHPITSRFSNKDEFVITEVYPNGDILEKKMHRTQLTNYVRNSLLLVEMQYYNAKNMVCEGKECIFGYATRCPRNSELKPLPVKFPENAKNVSINGYCRKYKSIDPIKLNDWQLSRGKSEKIILFTIIYLPDGRSSFDDTTQESFNRFIAE